MSKLRGRSPALPSGYDEAHDPLILRHYHPPLMAVLVALVTGTRDERVLRSPQLLGALAFLAFVILSYRGLSLSPTAAGYATVSALAAWAAYHLFGSISMHGWAAVWTTAIAALLGRWLVDGRRRLLVVLCACCALLLLTLETGLIVCTAAAACAWAWPPASAAPQPAWRRKLAPAGLVALILVALWPGVVIKVSLLKTVFLYVYRIRLGDEYASVPGRYMALALELLPVWLPGTVSVFWLVATDRAAVRRWGPFAVVGGLYSLALLRFALSPIYVIAGSGPLIVLLGYTVDQVGSSSARAILVTASLLVIGLSPWPDSQEDRDARVDLRYLAAELRGKEAFADGGHIYQYYLGQGYAIHPVTVSYDGQSLSVRENGVYRKLGRQELMGKTIVLQARRRVGPALTSLLEGSRRTVRSTVCLYQCP